ncbi:UDP-N-acetylmuramate dehydrogenase [Weissella soli]|uniref:UDP-N-acetylmuramate dehydrogenase n=1 Tax=Weissella soli TaxID=155866 RepID=UPI0011BB533B|nr:UDP-N-acetylmuramate dehydrogenase [Weissella soli]QEA35197.1 UDP-N-acetylmuramate dehydrogenase [Weissella soli]
MNNVDKLLNEGIDIKFNQKLKDYSHTKTGGTVKLMFFPKNLDQLKMVINWARSANEHFVILGEMTNVAIASGSLNFVVINMSNYNSIEPKWDGNRILTVTASYKMKELSNWAINNNIRGLGWMEGIPGTVGAGIYMNAGFLLGQDMETYLVDVTYLDLKDMSVKTLKNQELKFGYRYSKLQEMDAIILSGRFLLNEIPNDWKKAIRKIRYKKIMREYHERRQNNQPLDLPSAGTVFVPPYPWHVGGMLRELGLVGYQIGGAQISAKSPGFIVGVDNMTGEDYFSMVRFIQNEVKVHYDIDLEPEVILLKNDDIHIHR